MRPDCSLVNAAPMPSVLAQSYALARQVASSFTVEHSCALCPSSSNPLQITLTQAEMTMRPQHMITLALSVIQGIALSGVLTAQQRDASLEGVWRFVEEVDRRADGSLVKVGPAAGYNGLLIFTSNGYMSSTIMPKGRTWRRATVTTAQLRDTFEGASAHAGRYQPDSAKHTVRMENIMSLDPADEGKWDVVGYRVRRDTLELTGPWTYNGEKLTFTIRLARLK